MTRAVSVAALAALCLTSASAAQPVAGRIVFTSSSGVTSRAQVWVMNADGGRRHALTPRTAAADGPDLSPEGMRIAFTAHGHIYVIGLRGHGLRRLTNDSRFDDSDPAWSGDGRSIVFTRFHSGDSDIWRMRADGSHAHRLTPLAHGQVRVEPDWSRNGLVAYARQGRIWVMSSDGSRSHAVTAAPPAGSEDGAPSWSPDGERIAFESTRGTGSRATREIWIVRVDGSRPVRLTANAVDDSHPTWSPDGRWLAFASHLRHSRLQHVWAMQPNGKGLHRVSAATADESDPSWSG